MQQYIPKIAFSDALLLPCYVTVTQSITVHRALKRGADWLRPQTMLQAVARQEAGDKLSVTDAALVSGFVVLKMTGSLPEALLQVAKDMVTPQIVKDAAKQAAKAAMLENSLRAALAVMHNSLEQMREGAANTAGRFVGLQAQTNVRQAQANQDMCMHAQQLAAEKVQIEQQQAKLARQEAELSECQTAFQEHVTVYSMTQSSLTGATLGDASFAAGARSFAPVDSLVNPLWSPECALPTTPHVQAVEDVLARDLRIVTLPLDIPKVQVIFNEIFDVQSNAESQMWPVVRSADRHAELGAVPVTPSVHPRSLQSPQDFYTARSHLLAHEIVPVACSASSSTSSWSPSSCDSLMAGDQHKVVSDRSASGQSEHSCSVKEPSLVDMRHEVPSVSLERRHVVFTPKAQQVTALTGPVKSTSTAQEFSKCTATMSRRQVTPRPYPLGLSPAGACSTSNRGIGKRRGFKGAPACKTAGKICSKETMKPSAGTCSAQ